MDNKEYIASGIIERYVLGSVSDQERREVECMSSIYPELKDELTSVQSTIESYVKSIAVEPPKALKATILAAISKVQQDRTIQMTPTPTEAEKAEEEEEDKKIVPMRPYMKWAVMATLIPVIGFGMMYFSERNARTDLEGQLASAEQTNESNFKQKLSELEGTLEENKANQALILDESTTEILLAGTDLSPESQARVFWSPEKQQYMLISDRLPTPIAGKQYQLWAIADGVPVDLGMLDKSTNIKSPADIDLENIQAFAITLEKDGGNPAPTMDQMYVITKDAIDNTKKATPQQKQQGAPADNKVTSEYKSPLPDSARIGYVKK